MRHTNKEQRTKYKAQSTHELPILTNSLNRTTTHRLLTQRFLLFTLRLFVDKRIVFFITAHEVVRRGVAANVAIDAGGVYVERTADVFLNFVVSIGHFESSQACSRTWLRVRHLFRINLLVKLLPGQKPELDS
jgi:hypothetical protein